MDSFLLFLASSFEKALQRDRKWNLPAGLVRLREKSVWRPRTTERTLLCGLETYPALPYAPWPRLTPTVAVMQRFAYTIAIFPWQDNNTEPPIAFSFGSERCTSERQDFDRPTKRQDFELHKVLLVPQRPRPSRIPSNLCIFREWWEYIPCNCNCKRFRFTCCWRSYLARLIWSSRLGEASWTPAKTWGTPARKSLCFDTPLEVWICVWGPVVDQIGTPKESCRRLLHGSVVCFDGAATLLPTTLWRYYGSWLTLKETIVGSWYLGLFLRVSVWI